MAEAELREMMRDFSEGSQASCERLVKMPKTQRDIMMCCWLKPPSKSEIKHMSGRCEKIAIALRDSKERSIISTARYLQDKMGVSELIANDLAEEFGGMRALHYTEAKEWGCSERTYYRRLAKAGAIIGQVLYRAVCWQNRGEL